MNPTNSSGLRFGEFVSLVAFMTALVALSIDAILPALDVIGRDLRAGDENERQLVISALFLGLALAQIIYGPLSDSFGRRSPIHVGFALFLTGCLVSILANNFPQMLAGRVLQGAGAAGPRIVAIALVRDQYEGRRMARVMSLVMAVFILVPTIAPALGQLILTTFHWRAIFVLLLAMALVSWLWFALRQPETLLPQDRTPFSVRGILASIREVCRYHIAFGYTLAAGTVFGAFIGFLNSAQQIFQDQYGLGDRFPLYFAVLALSIGGSSLLNAKLVMRFGMRVLSHRALVGVSVLGLGFLALAASQQGHPALAMLMAYLILSFLCIGILFGNFNALAMEPLGHIAGVGAAVVGSLTTLTSLLLGAFIGALYDGTVLPLVMGFTLLGILSLGIVYATERGRATRA